MSDVFVELACQVYYQMLDESKAWKKHEWYVNDKLVDSPHVASFYARNESDALLSASAYWYARAK